MVEVKEREVTLTNQQSLWQVIETRVANGMNANGLRWPSAYRLRGQDTRLLATFHYAPEETQKRTDALPDKGAAHIRVYESDNPMPIVADEGELLKSEVCRLYRVYEMPEILSIAVSDACGLKEDVTLSPAS